VSDSLIELVESVGPESPVSRFLELRDGLHHLFYEAEDLELHVAFCKSVGTIILAHLSLPWPSTDVALPGR
jgi:hypothetical protein